MGIFCTNDAANVITMCVIDL